MSISPASGVAARRPEVLSPSMTDFLGQSAPTSSLSALLDRATSERRPLVVPGCYDALECPPRRAGRVRRRLHDGIRDHGVAARTTRRRPARARRDGRQRTPDHRDDQRAAGRRRGHRLRQPDQRDPHGARVRTSRRRGAAHRGPGHAEALRPHGEQAGHRHGVDDGQDPRCGRRPRQRRVPRDRPHGLAGDPRPRRGAATGERVRRCRCRHLVRRGVARRGRDRASGERSSPGSRCSSTGPKAARRHP